MVGSSGKDRLRVLYSHQHDGRGLVSLANHLHDESFALAGQIYRDDNTFCKRQVSHTSVPWRHRRHVDTKHGFGVPQTLSMSAL